MNRHLHLTFIEQPTPASGRTARRGSAGGYDPEGGAVMPPIDDPGSGAVMPPIDDPEGGAVMPPIDDPTGGLLQLAGSATALSVLAAASGGGCCCGCSGTHGASSPTSPAAATAPPGTYSGFVIVRMARGVVPDGFEDLRSLANATPLPGLQAALELPFASAAGATPEARRSPGMAAPSLHSRPLIELRSRRRSDDEPPPPALSRAETLAALRHLEERTATSAYPPLHSLASYWRIDLRQFPERVDEVVARLAALAEVDLAYRERAATDAKTRDPDLLPAEDASSGYDSDQGYFAEAPLGIGVNALEGQDWGSAKLTVCDLEQGWQPGHMDFTQAFADSSLFPVHGSNRADAKEDGPAAGHHGTAVLGQLAAGRAVRGAAAAFGRFYLSSHYRGKNDPSFPNFPGSNGHVASAIANVLPWPGASALRIILQAGDVLLLEVQRGLLPTEVDPADFDAIRLAAGLGIVVVEAAGNGGFDLDRVAAPDGRSLNRTDGRFRDSGAIVVGAARASLPHDRLTFSNFGSRVDCFSWGEAVTSCGYGDLAGSDPAGSDYYTNTFSGTSSASPVIAGAAALLQSLHQQQSGSPLAPRAMRAQLADPATGTPQGPHVAGAIGVMPDLGAITRTHGLVPVVYVRKNLCDDGSPLAPDDEVSGSPDLFVWPADLATTRALSQEGSGRENLPGMGHDLAPQGPATAVQVGAPPTARRPVPAPLPQIWVRLRNRGLGAGKARVQIFSAPAASLVTPERWRRLGAVDAVDVPQGDTLHLAGPLAWAAASDGAGLDPGHRFALLAVLTENEQQPLPPCPPYFDWAEFRAFQRGPGVAMRNVHRATAATDLPFFIANAPDGPHAFAFEILQRLPQGAQVTLDVSHAPGLAAKLRQRQPWLGGTGGLLTLPQQPRTLVARVELAAGYRKAARFKVTAGSGKPAVGPGHSLALRQLWRGEEVGRITWLFGP